MSSARTRLCVVSGVEGRLPPPLSCGCPVPKAYLVAASVCMRACVRTPWFPRLGHPVKVQGRCSARVGGNPWAPSLKNVSRSRLVMLGPVPTLVSGWW
jgi:hypothetical protein